MAKIREKGFHKALIMADSAEQRTIDSLKDLGLTRIFPAKKGPGSVRWGIQKLQSYQIFVHPSCKNSIKELSQYSWAKDRHDKTLDEPDKKAGFDHLMDALRYATEDSGMQKFSFE